MASLELIERRAHPLSTIRYGVFALQDLVPGTIIISERPLVSTSNRHLDSKSHAFHCLQVEEQFLFLGLQGRCCCAKISNPDLNTLTSSLANLSISDSTLTSSNQTTCEESVVGKIWNGVGFYNEGIRKMCIYYQTGFLNHSCFPNAYWYFGEGGKMEVIVERLVKKGDEVTVGYVEVEGLNVQERRKLVEDEAGFKCLCTACRGAGYGA